jgi:hypothetical protein
MAAISIFKTQGSLRLALATTLLVWLIASFTATVEESRTTWLLLALIALAGRLAAEGPEELAGCFHGAWKQSERAAAPVPGALTGRLTD